MYDGSDANSTLLSYKEKEAHLQALQIIKTQRTSRNLFMFYLPVFLVAITLVLTFFYLRESNASISRVVAITEMSEKISSLPDSPEKRNYQEIVSHVYSDNKVRDYEFEIVNSYYHQLLDKEED